MLPSRSAPAVEFQFWYFIVAKWIEHEYQLIKRSFDKQELWGKQPKTSDESK